MSLLSEIIEQLDTVSAKDRAQIIATAEMATKDMVWIPNPGPQTDAYNSKADVVLYGGEPGGGKSDCGLGLALTAHKRSLVMRRKYSDLSGLTDRSIEINGTRSGFNGSPPPKLLATDGRLIEFGAAQYVGDEQSWMGRAHDFLYIDEAAQFVGSQVRLLMGWVRSADQEQRCRIMLGTNPALSDEGDWIVDMFAPWLDDLNANPAMPGELRWFITDDNDKDIEVKGAGEYQIDGRTTTSMSRTYIPSGVKDNPFYADTGYQKQLDNLPAHLRKILMGGFKASRGDHSFQLIPTDWVSKSMSLWTPGAPKDVPQCAIGVDIAQGGTDSTSLAIRYGGWYDNLISVPGVETPGGAEVSALIFKHRRDQSTIILDMGGGYGGATHQHLTDNRIETVAYKGAEKSTKRAKNSKIPFYNTRTAAYYVFMEALDPNQSGGAKIILPDDRKLKAQLCSIRFDDNHNDLNVIKLEPKAKLIKRIGSSTDLSDSVVMAWYGGSRASTHTLSWIQQQEPGQVITGRNRKSISRRK